VERTPFDLQMRKLWITVNPWGPSQVRGVSTFVRPVLAEICLCHACSCHEINIEGGNAPGQGVVLSAVLYIFLTWAVVPDVSNGATFYFYTGNTTDGGLGFGDVTYSMLSVVGDIAMLGASYIYGAFLGSSPLRRLFIGLQLLNVGASVCTGAGGDNGIAKI
jgi:hypothetical protein